MLNWLRDWWDGVINGDDFPPYPLSEGDLDDRPNDSGHAQPVSERKAPKEKPEPAEWQEEGFGGLSPAL